MSPPNTHVRGSGLLVPDFTASGCVDDVTAIVGAVLDAVAVAVAVVFASKQPRPWFS